MRPLPAEAAAKVSKIERRRPTSQVLTIPAVDVAHAILLDGKHASCVSIRVSGADSAAWFDTNESTVMKDHKQCVYSDVQEEETDLFECADSTCNFCWSTLTDDQSVREYIPTQGVAAYLDAMKLRAEAHSL